MAGMLVRGVPQNFRETTTCTVHDKNIPAFLDTYYINFFVFLALLG